MVKIPYKRVKNLKPIDCEEFEESWNGKLIFMSQKVIAQYLIFQLSSIALQQYLSNTRQLSRATHLGSSA